MVADKVLSTIKSLKRKEFCVGNIAPDCNVENEDFTSFTPPRDITHWMSQDRKTCSDADRFFDEYINKRRKLITTEGELCFLYGYYSHLVADAEFQRLIRDEARVARMWDRIGALPSLSAKAKELKLDADFDGAKKLINKSERMKDIYNIEAEYLESHADSGYLTEILPLKNGFFPDYIDYLPKGAIVRKIGVMGYLPKKESGPFPFVSITREEYESFLENSSRAVVKKIYNENIT